MTPGGGWHNAIALFNASIGKSRLSLMLTAQPMTRLENKSMITAK